jgi:glycosyltransferase involved in cell wall biosynthesis
MGIAARISRSKKWQDFTIGWFIFSIMSIFIPKITVVTPSYNQAQYLESTILSVLNQNYSNLEYIIIDGGSTDGSVDIIKRYASELAYWVSEPDNGQSHAINKGLNLATGDWLCWQNSDDIFYPSTFLKVAEVIKKNPNVDFIIGDINLIDQSANVLRDIRYVKPSYRSLLAEGMVLTNQSAFWRRDLQDKVGLLNQNLHYGFDYDWFLRLLAFGKCTVHVPLIMGALRLHEQTKTSKFQPMFKIEYERILEGRELPKLMKPVFMFRRLFLMTIRGQFKYIFRGLLKRLMSVNKIKGS